MKDDELRRALDNYGEENEITFHLLDNPSFDNSILGISNTGKLVYDYGKMVNEFANDNDCSFEDAEEFIQYNTMRALPYFGDKAPIIIEHDIECIKEFYGSEDYM